MWLPTREPKQREGSQEGAPNQLRGNVKEMYCLLHPRVKYGKASPKKKIVSGSAEMARQLRALALAGDPGSVLSIHLVALNNL